MPTITCRQCGQGFEAVRRDARFCSPACRTSKHRRCNPAPPMNRTTSPSKRRREDEVFDLHDVLCETYYGMHPGARAHYLETLIDRAIEGDTKVKAVLLNPVLVRSHTGKGGNLQKRYHFRRCFAYPTIPFEAHRFTMTTWGVSLFDALDTPAGGTVYSTWTRGRLNETLLRHEIASPLSGIPSPLGNPPAPPPPQP